MRVVNVVDLMRLQPDTEHPHGMSDAEFNALFPPDRPVIFAYHGYPWLIHRLTYRRDGHNNFHVRGYKEEGTTTTPFDMVMMNDMDRFHLVMDVIDRVPGLAPRAARLRQQMTDSRVRARAWTREYGEDLPEVQELDLVGPMTPASTGDAGQTSGRAGAGASVIVVNAGSSSLKASLLGPGDTVDSALELRCMGRQPGPPRADQIPDGGRTRCLRRRHTGSSTAAARSAHAVLIDDSVIDAISGLTDLAPLHQPRALAGIARGPAAAAAAARCRLLRHRVPRRDAGCGCPVCAARRHGCSGSGCAGSASTASRTVTRRAGPLSCSAATWPSCASSAAISGAGASLAAVQGGRSVDTTMGFTPLEGLVMATRSGSVDPGLIIWLLQHGQLGLDEVAAGLEQSSGLAGLSGMPRGDMRDVQRAAADGDPAARLAIEVYLHRLRREIAAMAAAMNGLDALVFTGGIGEHNPANPRGSGSRPGVPRRHGLTPSATQATADADISHPAAPSAALVITAREDIEMARQARQVLARPSREGAPAGG